MRLAGLRSPLTVPRDARLAFVETVEEAGIALDGWSRMGLDAVVALEPEGAWALWNARRPYLTLEDAYDPRWLCDLADPMVEHQQAWAAAVDRWLQVRVPAFAQQDFQPARLHLYWLKIVFDSLAIRVHPIKWALDCWKPSWIWHPGHDSRHADFGWDLMFRDSLYPTILRAVAEQLNVDALIPEGRQAVLSAQRDMGAPHWMQTRGALGWLLRQGAMVKSSFQNARWAVARPRHEVFILADGYDLKPVFREALRHRMPVGRWCDVVAEAARGANRPDPSMMRALADAWPDAVSQLRLLDGAVVDRCDLRGLAEPRMRFWWEQMIPQQWGAFVAIRQQWAGKPPRAVAVSGLSDHVERGAFAAMRSIGARTCIYQHGGFVGACVCPPWDCNDLSLADCELTYGTGTADYFTERVNRYQDDRAVPIGVGSSRLDSWRGRIRRGRRVSRRPRILLVPNLIPRNSRYFDAGTTPDVLESELQLALVDAAREFPHYDFIFKAFPYPDQQATPAVQLARRPRSNCRVELRRPLLRQLATADFVVLTFASTALLEALMTDRRILVLVDPRFVMMRPRARELLSRRAHVATGPAEFLALYRRLLLDGGFGPLADPDDTFLREYGTHLNDGRSAERALASITAAAGPERPAGSCLIHA